MQYTEAELKQILDRHKHWLDEDCEGWEKMKPNLRGADLSYADLRGARLEYADLEGANLHHAHLEKARLDGADFEKAILRGANLTGATLSGANFDRANLTAANFEAAELGGACLRGANLDGVILFGAKNVPFIPMACPDTGSFIGWKKASRGEIIKLLIPEDAKRSSATGRKCRCDKAMVLSIEDRNGIVHDKPEKNLYALSDYDATFVYRVGGTVSVDNFCENRFIECAPGIHFFINKQEAIDYI